MYGGEKFAKLGKGETPGTGLTAAHSEAGPPTHLRGHFQAHRGGFAHSTVMGWALRVKAVSDICTGEGAKIHIGGLQSVQKKQSLQFGRGWGSKNLGNGMRHR